jgi:DNA-binding NarL/FixJ family response regulator
MTARSWSGNCSVQEACLTLGHLGARCGIQIKSTLFALIARWPMMAARRLESGDFLYQSTTWKEAEVGSDRQRAIPNGIENEDKGSVHIRAEIESILISIRAQNERLSHLVGVLADSQKYIPKEPRMFLAYQADEERERTIEEGAGHVDDVAGSLRDDCDQPPNMAAALLAGLTPRQLQIVRMVVAGHPSKNIAADLNINQRTVENHRAAIMKKTGAKSIATLVRLAMSAEMGAPR